MSLRTHGPSPNFTSNIKWIITFPLRIHQKTYGFLMISGGVNPTKWSNKLKQFVGNRRQIAWVCLTKGLTNWSMFLLHRNQSIDSHCKSITWFLKWAYMGLRWSPLENDFFTKRYFQWTGFYMISASIMKGLNISWFFSFDQEIKPCPRDIYIFVLPRKLQVKNLWRYHEYYNIL